MERIEDTKVKKAAHPAVHKPNGTVSAPSSRLFPRVDRRTQPSVAASREERAAAMARHPAGKGRAPDSGAGRSHICETGLSRRVHAGDTLWEIASEALRSDDPAAIASYWPRVHEANRAVIGTDPDLIRPGQILELPPCEQ